MGQHSYRSYQASVRRYEREEKKRHRELMRLEKERAKLSAIEQARLEVETYQNQLDCLLSVHKESCESWDWLGIAAALPEPEPVNYFHGEARAKQLAAIASPDRLAESEAAVTQWRDSDIATHVNAIERYREENVETEKLRQLALRVLDGERMAYIEAFAELNPVAEISAAGSLRQFAVHDANLIECVFKVSGNEVIPSYVKILTAGGKVSEKAMSRKQYHELYQDYICGCAVRMAREVFAMLPVSTLLVTALADVADMNAESHAERSVLSVAFEKSGLAAIDFEQVSATDAIEAFPHRGDFKVSRKAGAFQPIIPLRPDDLGISQTPELSLDQVIERVRSLHETLREDLG